jgi:hypothetical protein
MHPEVVGVAAAATRGGIVFHPPADKPAVGRMVILDVWKLETIYRIASLFALGVVLLVLGFIYNKYQEKIKEWL